MLRPYLREEIDMKRFALAVAAVCLSAGAALAADPLEGYWRTAKDDNGNSGMIHVAPCGAQLCGTLVKAYDANGKEMKSPNIGRKIISETVAKGGGAYTGKVYSPDRGKTYKSKLQMSGKSLKVSGCVLGICRDGGAWVKVK
tara:strand:+ start:57 stop:482 length:426 start_codon:yes stop_codon:yes gene_type:complete